MVSPQACRLREDSLPGAGGGSGLLLPGEALGTAGAGLMGRGPRLPTESQNVA